MQKITHRALLVAKKLVRAPISLWRKNIWWKILLSILSILIGLLAIFYGVSRWYVASNASKPLQLGVSFVPDYARSLDLDAEDTMDALIDDVGVRQFRLVSYWNKHEPEQGKYDFSDLDWQFKKAESADAKVSLAIGLRQPRWPECHSPEWIKDKPTEQWQPQLEKYIGVVIDRYKNSPSLQNYQLENEYFNDFGECPDHTRERLIAEFNVAKKHDSKHPIIISRSNNMPSLMLGDPQPDIVGASVYRRVWDAKITKSYYTYPFPSWYYAGIAGLQKIVTGKDSVLHEMQMEPWPPSGKFIADVSLEEQDKSFKANGFEGRIDFAKNTGMRSIDLWGAEWWYWRLEKANDPSVWREAKKAFHEN
jgi:hypothetical protein